MASEKPTWSFKANSEQDAALRAWMEEREDRNKTDAVSHFINEGIRRKQEAGETPSSLPTILLNGVVQMAVLAIVVLMLGPGLNIIRARTATIVGVGLLAAAFWVLVALHRGWVGTVQDRIRGHLEWARSEREGELDPEAEA